jgi:hypothetical protein
MNTSSVDQASVYPTNTTTPTTTTTPITTMSFTLLQALQSPIANGMTYGNNPDDQTQFACIAYRHPSSTTYFGGKTQAPKLVNGTWMFDSITSAIQGKSIPPKADSEVSLLGPSTGSANV